LGSASDGALVPRITGCGGGNWGCGKLV
jgi:hypothetical protein